MFVFTTKLSKKKAILILIALAVILTAIILLAGRRDQQTQEGTDAPGREVHTEGDIVAYLEHLGWQAARLPLEVQEIIIPREFDHVFEAYNHMQLQAGFDLSDYRGLPALRYSFQIENYPGQAEGVVADVLIVHNRIVGWDIQSVYLDGFIHGLVLRP